MPFLAYIQILRELRNDITTLHRRVNEGFLQINLRLNAIELLLLTQDTPAVQTTASTSDNPRGQTSCPPYNLEG